MNTENITFNGRPLAEHLSEEAGREISSVRNENVALKGAIHVPQMTRTVRNHSRARTSPGIVIYQAGQRETHVGILGDIFNWIDKAPFERSGHSVMGAVELDRNGLVKCHQCGTWHKDISSHVTQLARQGSSTHSTIKNYRIRHGLGSTHLASPELTDRRRHHGKTQIAAARTFLTAHKNHAARRVTTEYARNLGISRYSQNFNLTAACKAQRLEDLRILAKSLGRTPSKVELASFVNKCGRHSLEPHSLRNVFGFPLSKILLQAGLMPRLKGKNVRAVSKKVS